MIYRLLYSLFFWIVFETLLAVLLQVFGYFYFWPVFVVNLLAALVVIYYFFKKFKIDCLPAEALAEVGIMVFVVLVSVATLYQVHYNYTGKINLATDESVQYHEVKNMAYQYPYFSDEWDAVALINYSISSHSLPFKNPLDNSFFPNFATPFYSFLAGLVLLLKIDPLTSYNFLAIFINTLIVLICYTFLRISNLSKIVSAITALSILYITAGANLPGVWHLIPVHLGIIFCLLGFCFMLLNKPKMVISSGVAVLLFYPLLIVFYGLALAVYFLPKTNFFKNKFVKMPAVAGLLISRLFYPSLSGKFVPQYIFYYVIPIFSLVFFVFGIYYVFKKYKWLFSQFVLGAIFWILYSFVFYRIIIEYERVVFFTSIIVVIISGFGLKIVFDYLDKEKPISKYIGFCFLLFFVLFIPFYTANSFWQKFILVNPVSWEEIYPKAPANNYLVKSDIDLFKNIKNKKFLSIPWKGLVIGVATNNYPLVAKEGTISAGNIQTLNQFIQADCKKKENMAKNLKLDYIYLYEFSCEGFKSIGQSSEKFILYEVEK